MTQAQRRRLKKVAREERRARWLQERVGRMAAEYRKEYGEQDRPRFPIFRGRGFGMTLQDEELGSILKEVRKRRSQRR